MRLIDADKLKEKLLKMQKDIANKIIEPRGNTKSNPWKAAYLLVFDEYIKMLDEMPSAPHDRDSIYETYTGGYSKGCIEGSYNTISDVRKGQKDEEQRND